MLTYPNTRECKKCAETKDLDEFPRSKDHPLGRHTICRECKRKKDKEKYKKQGRGKHLADTYGITENDYNRMYTEQGGACKICSKNFPRLNVDHCHKLGTVRGLLCHSCNLMLGLSQDNITTLTNAIEYLRDHGSTDQVDPR